MIALLQSNAYATVSLATQGTVSTYQISIWNDPNKVYSISRDTALVPSAPLWRYSVQTRVTRQEVLNNLSFIKDETKRQQAENALNDTFTVFFLNTTSGEDPSYQWTNSSDPNISYSVSMNTNAPDGTEATFKVSYRISQAEIESLIKAVAATPAETIDERFSATIPIRTLLLGDLASDPNWDNAKVELAEGTSEDGTRIWTGYSITSEDGSVTRSVVFNLDPETPPDEKIQYIEMTRVQRNAIITGTYTAEALLGGFVAAGDWPIAHVTVSSDSFDEESRTVQNDFYDLTKADDTALRVAQIDLSQVPPRVTLVEQVDQQTMLQVVPVIRDEAQRQAAWLAIQDPLAVFYRIESGNDDPVYQWTSSKDPNLSYAIAVNNRVPVGTTVPKTYTTEAKFTVYTRISQQQLLAVYNLQKSYRTGGVIPTEEKILSDLEFAELERAIADTNA